MKKPKRNSARARFFSGTFLTLTLISCQAGVCQPLFSSAGRRPALEAAPAPVAEKKKGNASLDTLTGGEVIEGFSTSALYLTDDNQAIGGRFKHLRSGLTLDLIQIQTAPQAFVWVNTPPASDSGAAHTQEHLLLGKGSKGRSLRTAEQMSLVTASAMTKQWRTCYHFNTTAGAEVFYEHTERLLDALLNPDYTDDEIKREVCHYGILKDSKSGSLTLKEQGTVYNEMASSVHDPAFPLWQAEYRDLYGVDHPLSYSSGGTPDGL
ncbi:MAG TPA: hypothetical protein V6C72_03145, partial [Chroococcales cyanobacterium]